MYCVYWLLRHDTGYVGNHDVFSDLNEALKVCEMLRKEGCRFVTMAVEDPNMVGKMGAADVDENYDWVKRRDAISVRKKDL